LRDGDYYGSAVNRAARLMSAAHGGQVVVSAATAELVRDTDFDVVDLGEHRLRDLARAERVFQLTVPGVDAEFPPLRSLDAFPSNLPPQLTSFIGRDDDLGAVAKELDIGRLVTLIGVGGVGKTRLALQVAAEVLPRFSDGAWFCELATVDEPETMRQVVGATLGVQPRPGVTLAEGIVEFLSGKQLLLVLDNCEHLLRAAAQLASGILRECHDVRIIATSRESLGIAGEQTWPLASLAVPETAAFEDIGTSDSVRLFVDRAHAARPGFALTETNAEAVAEICRRLDGIPLAIELAAARVAAMSPVEISGLLDERFRLLTGGRRSSVERHQTLRATVDWSYSLLEPRERAVFDRLGVFAGSFDVRAAQAIVTGDGIETWDVLDALTELVAKSMIVTEETEDATTRYRLLETLRQYARERLDEAGTTDSWRRRHATHYAERAEELGPRLDGPDEIVWRRRLLEDLDNMRAVLTWSLDAADDADAEYGLRVLAAISYEMTTARSTAIGESLERAARRAETARPALRAIVLAAASGYAAHNVGDLEGAQALAESAIGDGLPQGAQRAVIAYGMLSIVAMQTGRIADARAWIAQAHRALDVIGDDPAQRVALHQLGALWAVLAHDNEAARVEADAALGLARQLGNPSRLSAALLASGRVREEAGDSEGALEMVEESIGLVRAGAIDRSFSSLLARAARLRTAKGDITGALDALREAVVYIQQVGMSSDFVSVVAQAARNLAGLGYNEPAAVLAGVIVDGSLATLSAAGSSERIQRGLARARDKLGEDQYRAAFARGAAMPYHEAITFLAAELDRAIADLDRQ
jgi:predicted ATPase